MIHWRVQFSFVLGSVSHFLPLPPPSRLCWFFSTDVFFFFILTGACSFPFLWESWLGCAVVPVMGTLFQSRGCLPIVQAPGYSRHPASFLAMQLLNWLKTRSWDYSIQVYFYSTHITRTTFATGIGEFVGTLNFRYAANEFYLKIGFTDYSGYHKEIIFLAYFMDIYTLRLLGRWVCAKVSCFFYDNFEKLTTLRSWAVVCQWVKNSHVQFRFVVFWVRVQRGTLSFLEIMSLLLVKNNYGFTEPRLL